MDSKELIFTLLGSLYTKLTRFETCRTTFTAVLLSIIYLELRTIVALSLILVLFRLCKNLCRHVYDTYMVEPFVCEGRAIVISGCDSGFGHDIAKHLDYLGFTVFAGCLYPKGYGARLLKAYCSKRIHVVSLDVRLEESVNVAFKYVEKHCPKSGLWGVVINGDIQMRAPVELMPISQCQMLHDVNMYGVIRMMKQFLPLIRKQAGRVITLTSVLGRYSYPTFYAYTSSKRGIETIMDSLRLEMKKFDVKISVIEADVYGHATAVDSTNNIDACKTAADQTWEEATEEQQFAYGRGHFMSRLPATKDTSLSTSDTYPMVRAVEHALTNNTPMSIYVADGTFRMLFDELAIMARLQGLLPTWLSDIITVTFTICDKMVK